MSRKAKNLQDGAGTAAYREQIYISKINISSLQMEQ